MMRGTVGSLFWALVVATIAGADAAAMTAGERQPETTAAPSLEVTMKRGRFSVDAGGTVSGWLVVANPGDAPAGPAAGAGYRIEMVLAGNARAVGLRPGQRNGLLAEPVMLEQSPDLEAGGETVLEFHVPVPHDLPQPAVLCARAVWREGSRGTVDGRNLDCSQLELSGRPMPVINYLFSGGFSGSVMGKRLTITADGVVQARGGELQLSQSEHRRLVDRARSAVAAGTTPGGGCPDGFTYTLEVGERSASVNQCVSSGPLPDMFDALDELADRVAAEQRP